MAICMAVALGVVILLRAQPVWLVLVAAVLFLPGIVARRLLSDLLESRTRIARRDHEGGLAAARRFLATLKAKPWIRHAIWGAFGIYTLDVAAMAHNNAGAALLNLDRLDECEAEFRAAVAVDPKYPMAFFNLAIVAFKRGNMEEARRCLETSIALGYPAKSLDAAHAALGESYARIPR